MRQSHRIEPLRQYILHATSRMPKHSAQMFTCSCACQKRTLALTVALKSGVQRHISIPACINLIAESDSCLNARWRCLELTQWGYPGTPACVRDTLTVATHTHMHDYVCIQARLSAMP